MESSSDRTETVGSDRVVYKADAVVIHAAREMADWKATRYRKTAVVLGETTYFVASRSPLPGGVWRYVLTPWPEDLRDPAGNVVHYDESYVLERDAQARAQKRVERKALGLLFVTWLLGFLWSSTKLRLNERYGIHPVTLTEQSLLLEYLAFICVGGLLAISVTTGIVPVLPQVAVGAFLAVDRVIRGNRAMRGGMRQYGFGEWIFRRLRGDD